MPCTFSNQIKHNKTQEMRIGKLPHTLHSEHTSRKGNESNRNKNKIRRGGEGEGTHFPLLCSLTIIACRYIWWNIDRLGIVFGNGTAWDDGGSYRKRKEDCKRKQRLFWRRVMECVSM